jgi:hypothetical protein
MRSQKKANRKAQKTMAMKAAHIGCHYQQMPKTLLQLLLARRLLGSSCAA